MSDTEDTATLLLLSQPVRCSAETESSATFADHATETIPAVVETAAGNSRFPTLVTLAACTAALGGLLFGYDIGIISDAMLHLRTEFQLTCHEQEMVVSFMLIGAFVSALTGGPLIDHIGSRYAIILNAFIFAVGAMVLVVAPNYVTLLCGRFIVGFAVALSAVSECIYIAEISQPHNRGMLVTLNEVGITLGFLLAYIAGYMFVNQEGGWRFMFGLSIIPAAIQGVGMFFLPNTPSHLILKKREEEAEKAVQKLRNLSDQQQIKQEITVIRLALDASKHQSFWNLCSNAENLRSCMTIAVGLVVAQQFTGQPNVLSYAPTIFEKVGFCGERAATLATVGLGVVKLLATIVSLCLIDKIGRRVSLLFGTVLMLFSLVLLSVFALQYEEAAPPSGCQDDSLAMRNMTTLAVAANCTNSEIEDGSGLRYVALGSLMSYVAAYSFGFGPVTWLILSEIFPAAIKGKAVAVSSSLNWASNLVVSATFLQFISTLSLGGVFLFYAVICAFAVAFIFAAVPETKNKSLHKISQELKNSTFSSRFISHLKTIPGLKNSRWLTRKTGKYVQLSSRVDETPT